MRLASDIMYQLMGNIQDQNQQYLDADIVDEILTTDELKEKVRILLVEEVYEQILFVIEHGVRYQVDKLTYSGFLSDAGEVGDLLIKFAIYIQTLDTDTY